MTHSDALRPASRATHRRPSRLDVLKWLAVLPLIPAGPLLFFGLAWFVPGLFALGLAFVAGALLVWRAFAGEWPVARTH